ncbi:MAG TPA: hypothetical protein VGE45_02530 [Chloroflexia bacterium]
MLYVTRRAGLQEARAGTGRGVIVKGKDLLPRVGRTCKHSRDGRHGYTLKDAIVEGSAPRVATRTGSRASAAPTFEDTPSTT